MGLRPSSVAHRNSASSIAPPSSDRRLIVAIMQPHEHFHAGFLIQLLGFVTPTYLHAYLLIETPDGEPNRFFAALARRAAPLALHRE